jgi:glycosyltransferase involved in cell wall biosynthesis
MGTRNGGVFLIEQLESIAAQTHETWRLYVSDDGSTDETLEILTSFAARFEPGRVTVRSGPKRGFALNFLSLACDPDIEADFYAFCDQDDRWHPRRLETSLRWLAGLPPGQPALYCSRTRYVDKVGRAIGLSPLFAQRPAFRNALVQSLAGGNTMTYNRATHSLLFQSGPLEVVSHDWWIYQLVTGCGGTVHYDPEPSVDYRQHGGNVIGSNSGLMARWWRIREMFFGRFSRWNTLNEEALKSLGDLLLPENRRTLEEFGRARREGLVGRCCALWRSGVYRQTPLGTLGLWVGTLIRRI